MTIEPRPYQRAAIDAIGSYFSTASGNPLIVLPTGSGKSLVQAVFLQETFDAWPETRVICLTHVRELISQNLAELRQVWPMAPVGIYSAGLRRRDTDDPILFAGIASVHGKAPLLGRFDLVIIDECHLVSLDGATMYRKLLGDLRIINPKLKVIGLTATPYRLGSGLLTEGEARIFTDIAYSADLKGLIADGFLAPLVSKAGAVKVDLSSVHQRGGEYIPGELSEAMDKETITEAALDEVVIKGADRRSWLFFCSGVQHAQHVADALGRRGIPSGCITGETEDAERDALISRFKAGELRALTSMGVLTTGFNAPAVDLLVFLRPTQSTALYVQMAGRGMRMAEGKTDCLVLDYSGNVLRHGPVDAVDPKAATQGGGIAPAKECPQCAEVVHLSVMTCPGCGYAFPPAPAEEKIKPRASEAPILSAPPVDETWEIKEQDWQVWTKKGAQDGDPKTLRVTYRSGLSSFVSEWVCFEHALGSFAQRKAAEWWAARVGDEECPSTALDALERLDALRAQGTLRLPTSIIVRTGLKFPEIVRHHFARNCTECRHYDVGHCVRWEADVPETERARGCDQWSKSEPSYAASLGADEQPPF